MTRLSDAIDESERLSEALIAALTEQPVENADAVVKQLRDVRKTVHMRAMKREAVARMLR